MTLGPAPSPAWAHPPTALSTAHRESGGVGHTSQTPGPARRHWAQAAPCAAQGHLQSSAGPEEGLSCDGQAWLPLLPRLRAPWTLAMPSGRRPAAAGCECCDGLNTPHRVLPAPLSMGPLRAASPVGVGGPTLPPLWDPFLIPPRVRAAPRGHALCGPRLHSMGTIQRPVLEDPEQVGEFLPRTLGQGATLPASAGTAIQVSAAGTPGTFHELPCTEPAAHTTLSGST